jgi:hypothetical protein
MPQGDDRSFEDGRFVALHAQLRLRKKTYFIGLSRACAKSAPINLVRVSIASRAAARNLAAARGGKIWGLRAYTLP